MSTIDLESKQETSITDLTRRDFNIATAVGLAAFFLEIKKTIAGTVQELIGCTETAGSKTLAQACEHGKVEGINEAERIQFAEAIRSAPAFEEMATMLPNVLELKDKKLRVLYPASGAHIAPLALISKLIDEGKIEEAEIIMTDIDDCSVPTLSNNLDTLQKLVKNFVAEPNPDKIQYVNDAEEVVGQEYVIKIKYKGKPIKIRFMLRCSGGAWFRNDSLPDIDVIVNHDSAAKNSLGPLFIFLHYMKGRREEKVTRKQAFIMEDVTEEGGFRVFDLELLGKFTRTETPYGHRAMQESHPEKLSRGAFCKLREYAKAHFFAPYSSTRVDEWKSGKSTVIPYEAREMYVETGYPLFSNGALLEIHPQLFDLSQKELEALVDIVVMAKTGTEVRENNALTKNRTANLDNGIWGSRRLTSENTIKEMAESLPKLFEHMKSINPKLAAGLACRVLQAFNIFLSATQNFDPSQDGIITFAKIGHLFDTAVHFLPDELKTDKKIKAELAKAQGKTAKLEKLYRAAAKHASDPKWNNPKFEKFELAAMNTKHDLANLERLFNARGDIIFSEITQE